MKISKEFVAHLHNLLHTDPAMDGLLAMEAHTFYWAAVMMF